MALKFGKKNEIKLTPLSYNVGLMAPSGFGKTTIIHEYTEKLTGGKDGSVLFCEVGHEDGGDAINGLPYINCPDWDSDYEEDERGMETIGFKTLIDDIVENKETDWKDLKVVVIDTYDELTRICDKYVVDKWNKEVRLGKAPKNAKESRSIKGAYGGYQAGEDLVVDLIVDTMWSLKKAGVNFVVIFHTKVKNITDATDDSEFAQITASVSAKYFGALKTKLHFLATGYYKRETAKVDTGIKEFASKDTIKKSVLTNETRRLSFRSDALNIDGKSRFASIDADVEFGSDNMIKVIEDAIKTEHAKSGNSYEKDLEKQKKADEKFKESLAKKEGSIKEIKQNPEEAIEKIITFMKENKTDKEKITPLLNVMKDDGYSRPMDIDSPETIQKLLDLIEAM